MIVCREFDGVAPGGGRPMTIEGVHVWHFLPDDRRLRFPPHTYIKPGVVVRAEGPITMCLNGCHGSVRAIDALCYAKGSVVTRCIISGEISQDENKIVGRERECLALADAARELREFACDEAELALRRHKVEDERAWRCIEVSRLFARGEVDAKALRDAWDAAWGDAAWGVAQGVAWGPAQDAARDAVWQARRLPWGVGRNVVRAAACDVARETVCDVARETASNAARDEAWDVVPDRKSVAAQDAARDAARDRQNRDLERRLRPLLGMAVPGEDEVKDG